MIGERIRNVLQRRVDAVYKYSKTMVWRFFETQSDFIVDKVPQKQTTNAPIVIITITLLLSSSLSLLLPKLVDTHVIV